MKRKKYSNKLKAEIAIAAIKGHKTVNEIAAEFTVNPSMVNRLKKLALDSMIDVFSSKKEKNVKAMEAEKDLLFQQIGKLQFEVEWLKKIPGICCEY